jgi:hypothetical protein
MNVPMLYGPQLVIIIMIVIRAVPGVPAQAVG